MVALNVGASWNKTVDAEFDARHYDAEIRLEQPYPAERLESALGSLPSVSDVETWLEVESAIPSSLGTGLYPDSDNSNHSNPFRTIATRYIMPFGYANDCLPAG